MHTPPCRCCGVPLHHRYHQPHRTPTSRRHEARGLCNSCYLLRTRDGTVIDYPRATLPRDDLLDDWVLLRDVTNTHTAASRLGLTLEGFRTALYRARRAGDTRVTR